MGFGSREWNKESKKWNQESKEWNQESGATNLVFLEDNMESKEGYPAPKELLMYLAWHKNCS